MQASEIINRATLILQDETNIRWTRPELLGWVNDAQREIVVHRPAASSINTTLTLAPGSRQELPPAGIQLLDVIRNVNGRAVRIVSRNILDAQQPDWHQHRQDVAIKHFMFDDRSPRNFYVYPPAAQGAKLEVSYSTAPVDATTESSQLSLNDIYANAILDFVLYRAYTKDADFAGNAARAESHYQKFASAVGIKQQGDAVVSPNTSSPGAR